MVLIKESTMEPETLPLQHQLLIKQILVISMVKLMATAGFLPFTAKLSAGYLALMVMFPSLTQADQHELIYMTDSTTEMSGSITLQCRNDLAEPLEINQIKFWLNRTSACDLDLREREDVRVIRVNDNSIKLNVTRNLEGSYTCGQLIAQDDRIVGVEESNPVTLVCKFSNSISAAYYSVLHG